MKSLNKAQIIGNVGKDPEAREIGNDSIVCNMSVATTSAWKDRSSGERKEATEWHRVAAFGRLAEIMRDYVRSGQKVYVEGRLQTRKWKDKEDTNRFTTEIIAHDVIMLSDGRGADKGGTAQVKRYKEVAGKEVQKELPIPGPDDLDDDIPF